MGLSKTRALIPQCEIISYPSYQTETVNMLVENQAEPVNMDSQNKENPNSREWRIEREYISQFSCREAVERIIKAHCGAKKG